MLIQKYSRNLTLSSPVTRPSTTTHNRFLEGEINYSQIEVISEKHRKLIDVAESEVLACLPAGRAWYGASPRDLFKKRPKAASLASACFFLLKMRHAIHIGLPLFVCERHFFYVAALQKKKRKIDAHDRDVV